MAALSSAGGGVAGQPPPSSHAPRCTLLLTGGVLVQLSELVDGRGRLHKRWRLSDLLRIGSKKSSPNVVVLTFSAAAVEEGAAAGSDNHRWSYAAAVSAFAAGGTPAPSTQELTVVFWAAQARECIEAVKLEFSAVLSLSAPAVVA